MDEEKDEKVGGNVREMNEEKKGGMSIGSASTMQRKGRRDEMEEEEGYQEEGRAEGEESGSKGAVGGEDGRRVRKGKGKAAGDDECQGEERRKKNKDTRGGEGGRTVGGEEAREMEKMARGKGGRRRAWSEVRGIGREGGRRG